MHLLSACLAASVVVVGTLSDARPAPSAALRPQDDSARGDGSSGTVLIRAKRVIVRPGQVVENATVLVRDGLIVSVSDTASEDAPEGATVIEGEVVCAGFIDPWSALGLSPDTLADSRLDAAARATDALDSFGSEHARERALQAGVVAVHVIGGEGQFRGLGALVSNGPGADLDALVLLADATVGASLGSMSRGSVPDVFERISQVDKLAGKIKSGADYAVDHTEYRYALEEWNATIAEAETKLDKDFKKAKKDRDKDVKEAEEKGKEFKEKKYKEDKKPKPPKFDAEKEALARVAEGELPLVVIANRAAELRELLVATRPFERLRLIVAGGTDALLFADELAARRIPVIVWPAPLGTGRPDEYDRHDLSLAAQLAEKDVSVLIGSGGSTAARDLPLLASLAIGHGLDREEAFAALTERAARALDVADQLGSVRRGRRADLLVLDGSPLVATTRVQSVLVGGRVVVSADR